MSSAQPQPRREGLRFELLERLGKGASGTVWRARMFGRHGVSREIALKIAQDREETVLRRLRDEARLLGLMRHRGLVAVQDLVRLDNASWGLVMEVLDGVDLQALRAQGPIPTSALIEIGREVADVLDRAYNALDHEGRPLALMHRDIKPANVMLCVGGAIKVLDFGVAKAQTSWRESLTLHGETWGTPGYMAPERHFGEDSPTSDIYSLGVMLYQLSVGQRFGRAVPDPREHGLRLGDAADKLIRVGASPDLVHLISAMMAFQAADRPSPREVVHALTTLRRRHPEPTLQAWSEVALAIAQTAREEKTWGPDPGAQTLWAHEDENGSGGPTLLVAPSQPSPPARPRAPRHTPLVGGILGVLALATLSHLLGRATIPPAPPAAPAAVVARAAPAPDLGGAAPDLALAPPRSRALEPEAPPVVARPPAPARPPTVVAAAAVETAVEAAVETAVEAAVEAAPETEAHGTVMIKGDPLDLFVVSAAGSFPVPGAVPEGTYTLRASFGAESMDLGAISVPAGGLVSLRCDAIARTCR